MKYRSAPLVAAFLCTVLASGSAAQVVFPHDPAEFVAMLDDDALETDAAYRAFMTEAVRYALTREADLAEQPYTEAFRAWLNAELQADERGRHMFGTSWATEVTVSGPIDLYLLMGQSNMVGITESGHYHGPDDEIRAALQAATPDRTVVTFNCALSATFLAWWEPDLVSFTDIYGHLRHNLTRTCIEGARGVHNAQGERAHVRGIFFYQGEADVSLATGLGDLDIVDSWPQRYAEIIDYLRIEFGDIPAVHAQIAISDDPDPSFQTNWARMQTRQAEATSLVGYSAMIVTNDLSVHDGIHLDDASQAIAGQRFADAMLGLVAP